MVKLTTPEASPAEHEKLTRDAEICLEKLGLPYRRVALCTADIGFSANKCFDLEVWLPSITHIKKFQAVLTMAIIKGKEANTRYRTKDGQIRFVHTINGSGLAVGRTFAAILENFQQEDGTVIIPEVLKQIPDLIKYKRKWCGNNCTIFIYFLKRFYYCRGEHDYSQVQVYH